MIRHKKLLVNNLQILQTATLRSLNKFESFILYPPIVVSCGYKRHKLEPVNLIDGINTQIFLPEIYTIAYRFYLQHTGT